MRYPDIDDIAVKKAIIEKIYPPFCTPKMLTAAVGNIEN